MSKARFLCAVFRMLTLCTIVNLVSIVLIKIIDYCQFRKR
nr:MAG TPA: hypothetical protein [Bacteriophage sp.]